MEEIVAVATEKSVEEYIKSLQLKNAMVGGFDKSSVMKALSEIASRYQPAMEHQVEVVNLANKLQKQGEEQAARLTEQEQQLEQLRAELAECHEKLDPKVRFVEQAREDRDAAQAAADAARQTAEEQVAAARALAEAEVSAARADADEKVAAAQKQAREAEEAARKEVEQTRANAEQQVKDAYLDAQNQMEQTRQEADAKVQQAQQQAAAREREAADELARRTKEAEDAAHALVLEAEAHMREANAAADAAEKHAADMDRRNDQLNAENMDVRRRITEVCTQNVMLDQRNLELEEREKTRAADHEKTMKELGEKRTKLAEELEALAAERTLLAKTQEQAESLRGANEALNQSLQEQRESTERECAQMLAEAEERCKVESKSILSHARVQAWDVVNKAEREAHSARADAAQYWLDLQDEVKLLEERREQLLEYLNSVGYQLLEMHRIAICPPQPEVPDEPSDEMPKDWLPMDEEARLLDDEPTEGNDE